MKTLNSIITIAILVFTSACTQAPEQSEGWPFRTIGEAFSLPTFDKENIYFGESEGIFYCLDKSTGEIRWKRSSFGRIDSSPIIEGDLIYFTAIDSRAYALSIHNGSTVWKSKISGVEYSNLKIYQNSILLGAENQLVALDAKNGKSTYSYPVKGEVWDFSWNNEGIAIASTWNNERNNDIDLGAVTFFTHGSTNPKWQLMLGAESRGPIIFERESYYLGAWNGRFYSLNTADGQKNWVIDCAQLFTKKEGVVWAGHFALAHKDEIIFSVAHQIINSPSLLVCASQKDGKIRWKVEHPTLISGTFIVVREHIVAATEDRKILTVDIQTGESQVLSILPEQGRGEFAGIRCDGDYIFVVGADAHIWRYPLSEILPTNNNSS
jgi:outer membrane protein assembly factor BamB